MAKQSGSNKRGKKAGPASRKPARAVVKKGKPAKQARAARPKVKPAKPGKPAPKGPSKPAKAAVGAKAAGPAATKSNPPSKAAPAAAAAASKTSKSGRKGITIVTPKPPRKPKPAKPVISVAALAGQLLPPGAKRKPLIPSGPKAPPRVEWGVPADGTGEAVKSPMGKKELAKFRAILLAKRAELVGDVSTMESEALMGHGGDLSHTPQHMAEQGTDTYEQTLSLDLAAADRKLIREIEDALKRIDNGTYGICELTRQPIRSERLEELPWTRYSIEAARELERRSMRS